MILLGILLLIIVIITEHPVPALLSIIVLTYGLKGTSAPLEEIEYQINDDPQEVRTWGGRLSWALALIIGLLLFLILTVWKP